MNATTEPSTPTSTQGLTLWCVVTTAGARRQFATPGKALPAFHHEPQTGFAYAITRGHILGSSSTCEGCNPPVPLGAPGNIDVTPIPRGVSVCSGCLAEATAEGRAYAFGDRDAAFLLVPDNGRDGMSTCSAHIHAVRAAMTQWPDDASSWAALVDGFHTGA